MASRTKRQPRTPRVSRRTRTVWGALLGAMTVVGGSLLALDGAKAPAAGGVSLPPLAATAGPDTVEVIFRTTQPLDARRWQAIVIHDTGTPSDGPESLDAHAREMGLKKGLGYHFVIGNGRGMADGELHVGGRWLRQDFGAHTAGPNSDWFNRNSIGICLVGDGERRPFTPAQIRRLVQVVEALRKEFGISADKVFLHSQLADTASPGTYFPEAEFRKVLGQ